MYKKSPTATIKVGAKAQIVIPSAMRAELGICAEDELFASIEGETIVLQKMPKDPIERLRWAFRGVYDGVDVATYIRELRDEWDD
jgi:bifunctional DNA-binding transcriptional regulator/antitoxin component of YhaV-PrlF toxin-antitoxin module